MSAENKELIVKINNFIEYSQPLAKKQIEDAKIEIKSGIERMVLEGFQVGFRIAARHYHVNGPQLRLKTDGYMLTLWEDK